jgi:hypothetical protein
MVPHDVNEKEQAQATRLFGLIRSFDELCKLFGCDEVAGDEINDTRL